MREQEILFPTLIRFITTLISFFQPLFWVNFVKLLFRKRSTTVQITMISRVTS